MGRDDGKVRQAGGGVASDDAISGDARRLLIVFASDSLDQGATLAGIRSVAGRVPLIGCSTAGEISHGGPGDAGVVVIALGGEGFEASVGAATGASTRLRAAGAEAAACAGGLNGAHPNRVLIMLTDGLAGDQQEIVRGAYAAVGAGLPLVGGCAGD